jgi:hypothetical protein
MIIVIREDVKDQYVFGTHISTLLIIGYIELSLLSTNSLNSILSPAFNYLRASRESYIEIPYIKVFFLVGLHHIKLTLESTKNLKPAIDIFTLTVVIILGLLGIVILARCHFLF